MKFHTLKTLMLADFMDILIKGDMSLIVIEGNPTASEINDVWEILTHEYAELTSPDKYKSALTNAIKIEGLRLKIYAAEKIMDGLEVLALFNLTSKVLLDELSDIIPSLKGRQFESIPALLRTATSLLKTHKRTLKREVEESLLSGNQAVYTEKYFAEVITAIELSLRAVVEPAQCSVFRFAGLVDRLRKHNSKIWADKYKPGR